MVQDLKRDARAQTHHCDLKTHFTVRKRNKPKRKSKVERQTARARLLVSGYQCYVGNIQRALVAPGDSYKNEQQSINSTR